MLPTTLRHDGHPRVHCQGPLGGQKTPRIFSFKRYVFLFAKKCDTCFFFFFFFFKTRLGPANVVVFSFYFDLMMCVACVF